MATSLVKNNLPFFKQEFATAVGSSSVVVKFISGAIVLGYLLTFFNGIIDHITVTAGHPFAVWTFVTHSFVQFHLWHVFIDIAVVVLCGKLLEPLWGAFGLMTFYFIVNLSVAVLCVLSLMFVYLLYRDYKLLFDTWIHGQAGYIAGFTVAVKQIMPDNVLIGAPFGKIRNKHIPLVIWLLSVFGALCGALEGIYPLMVFWGIVVSWTYLRFYQRHSSGQKGDMADTFTFASFFPSGLEPFVAVLSNTVFSVLVKIKVCKKPERRYDVSSPNTVTVRLPGTEPHDAERRRQVALKALNERLTKVDTNPSWPSMDSPSPSPSPTKESPELAEVKVERDKPPPTEPEVKVAPPRSTLPVPDFRESAEVTEVSQKSPEDNAT